MDFQTTLHEIDRGDLEGFFEGWPDPPSPATHYRILENSHEFVLAVDPAADRSVAGFVNAVSDGILAAYLPLLEVRPRYRGEGLGTELVERIKSRLDELYMVDAICDPQLAGWYEDLGFRRLAGMAIRNYEQQSG